MLVSVIQNKTLKTQILENFTMRILDFEQIRRFQGHFSSERGEEVSVSLKINPDGSGSLKLETPVDEEVLLQIDYDSRIDLEEKIHKHRVQLLRNG